MSIQIVPLQKVKPYKDQVIKWLFNEWGNNNPQYWKSWIESSLSTDGIPITYVAVDNDVLIGTISIWRCDLQARQDLFPWIGGLFVDPQFRGKEYGGYKLGVLLQDYCICQLKKWGFREVFLFAEPELFEYYSRNNWEKIGSSFDEKDNDVDVFRYQLFETDS